MHNIVLLISKALPIFFLIVLGNLMQRHKFFSQDVINQFKKIVMNFSLPAMIFLTFAQTKFESKYVLIILVVFVAMCFTLFAGMGLKKLFRSENPYFPTVFGSSEAGMIGYPLFITVYGTSELYKLAIMDLGQALFCMIVLISYMKKLNGKSIGTMQLLKDIIKTPIIISIIAGIIFSLTGLMDDMQEFPLSVSVIETLKLISNLTVPMICMVIGYELNFNFKNIFKPLTVVMTRITILMVVAFLINTFVIENLLHLDYTFSRALYILFVFPISFIVPINMESDNEEDKQFILNTISISVLISLVAFMVLAIIL